MVTIVYYEEEKANKAYLCFIKKLKEVGKKQGIIIMAIYKLDDILKTANLIGFKEDLSSELIEECKYAFTECFKEYGMFVVR